ncbi:ATP-binding cassette domain-containing protein [Streptomyces sp. SID8366]|uniref:dipeptide/oligopeptide/nickel ABC transporter permease/ATP-binding protein n=1 Tax=unclassified Streptomyces TaxID=2593676 RepID=UPI000DB9D0ED|nr:dipeptide/oligopeptide/nickel ABC transporter permease/ATP-binding protein [Streptomyces sp. PsTaAH-130]MYU06005.1 ATP-binding cassette domain-containing protein [Streptomyces sp. SID8366]MYU64348.1 ATP-binding cassette domain-containing protein [Streptomyces sp. SID69]RAJ64064.1 oligopeptide/dipeptide ABC transporter ATP-binding protein [Streptomyces sp. PsTaAH-130]
MRRLLTNPASLLGAALVAVMVLLALIAPPIWESTASRIDPGQINQGATSAHLLGTDALGRDLLARTLVATRLTLGLAFLATLIGTVSGIVLGALPALLPRRAGRVVVAAVDILVAFPALLLAMFTAVVTGLGARGAVLGIGVALAPTFARLTHTLTASLAGADYIAAARMLQVPRRRILTRHILPNIAEPLILNTAQAMGSALLGLSAMSFLGMGVQAPSYDWGRLLNEAFGHVYVTPSVVIAPATAVALAGLGFMLLGDTFAKAAAGSTAPAGKPVAPIIASCEDAPVSEAVLDVSDLTVAFPGGVTPVRQVSLTVGEKEIVGLVGESGSGKSMTAAAIGRIVPYPGLVGSARMRLCGTDLDALTDAERRKLLGTSLAMVFQDPTSSLNPALRVGGQLAEVATLHDGATRTEARTRAVERLARVYIKEPAQVVRQYPHELSGGMRQRAVIAMGLMGTPRLIIADEPTTALDVTVQREVVKVLREIVDDTRAGALFISHDIAVVSELCDRIAVMYAGRIVEELPADALHTAQHPYTQALIGSLPDMDTDRSRPLATIPGRQPAPGDVTDGCAFADRCALATDRCSSARPELRATADAHAVACWEAP